jgi:hypothetical protein
MAKQISSRKVVWTSFLVDLGDIALNVIVMLATGSVVMLAEAFEGLSDLVASGPGTGELTKNRLSILQAHMCPIPLTEQRTPVHRQENKRKDH